MVTNNIDAGVDAHKSFDLFKPQNVSWKEYLLYLFNRGTEDEETTWRTLATWPSMKTAPEEVKELLRPYNETL